MSRQLTRYTKAASDTDEFPGDQATNSGGLDGAVGTCRIIGQTLSKIYGEEKVSTAVVQEIAYDYKGWTRDIHPALTQEKLLDGHAMPPQNMVILHIQLLGCYSVISSCDHSFYTFSSERYVEGSRVDSGKQSTHTNTLQRMSVCINQDHYSRPGCVSFTQHLPRQSLFVL